MVLIDILIMIYHEYMDILYYYNLDKIYISIVNIIIWYILDEKLYLVQYVRMDNPYLYNEDKTYILLIINI